MRSTAASLSPRPAINDDNLDASVTNWGNSTTAAPVGTTVVVGAGLAVVIDVS